MHTLRLLAYRHAALGDGQRAVLAILAHHLAAVAVQHVTVDVVSQRLGAASGHDGLRRIHH